MNTGIFVGNISKDAEVRTTGSGKKVGTFSIACNRQYTDPKTGETKNSADFINVVLWGNYDFSKLSKGVPVMVIGRQQTRSYETKDGEKRWMTEIIASDVGLALRPQKAGSGDFSQFAADDGFNKPKEGYSAGGYFKQEDIPF